MITKTPVARRSRTTISRVLLCFLKPNSGRIFASVLLPLNLHLNLAHILYFTERFVFHQAPLAFWPIGAHNETRYHRFERPLRISFGNNKVGDNRLPDSVHSQLRFVCKKNRVFGRSYLGVTLGRTSLCETWGVQGYDQGQQKKKKKKTFTLLF